MVYWHLANQFKHWPGRVATGVPVFKSLVWLNPEKTLTMHTSVVWHAAPGTVHQTPRPLHNRKQKLWKGLRRNLWLHKSRPFQFCLIQHIKCRYMQTWNWKLSLIQTCTRICTISFSHVCANTHTHCAQNTHVSSPYFCSHAYKCTNAHTHTRIHAHSLGSQVLPFLINSSQAHKSVRCTQTYMNKEHAPPFAWHVLPVLTIHLKHTDKHATKSKGVFFFQMKTLKDTEKRNWLLDYVWRVLRSLYSTLATSHHSHVQGRAGSMCGKHSSTTHIQGSSGYGKHPSTMHIQGSSGYFIV